MAKDKIEFVGGDEQLLKPLISRLKSFDSKRGAEGVAYFVGKEFIIKYFERINLGYHTFDNYCYEIKKFADGGLACPKIYSWAKSPICAEDNVYRYYILQEQVAGEELIPYSMTDIESRCLTFCSRNEFDLALSKIADNKALYGKMVNEFVTVVLERNKQLESLSREEIARFINSYIEINKNSVFSSPDLHPGNVLFDGNKLTIIDETMTFSSPNKWKAYDGSFKEHYFKVQSFYDLLYLFAANRHIQSYIGYYEQETGEMVDRKILLSAEENKKVFGNFMQAWVEEGMKLFIPKELTELDIDMLYTQINDLVDAKSADKILAEFQR